MQGVERLGLTYTVRSLQARGVDTGSRQSTSAGRCRAMLSLMTASCYVCDYLPDNLQATDTIPISMQSPKPTGVCSMSTYGLALCIAMDN